MKMVPLLDRSGHVKAWADPRSGWVCNLAGNVFAVVAFDGVFNLAGSQIGWWFGDHLRDRYGHIVLSRLRPRIVKVTIPQPNKIPRPPNLHLPSGHPTLRWLLMPPLTARGWADFGAFLGALGHTQMTAAEKLRDFRERIGRRNG